MLQVAAEMSRRGQEMEEAAVALTEFDERLKRGIVLCRGVTAMA